jgi:thiol:disulfide interchange protein DsbC
MTYSKRMWFSSIAVVCGVGLAGGVVFATTFEKQSSSIKQALAKRLPKTQISNVDCQQIDGLCEIVSGNNLFYVDKSARYLVIGRVYDMETRQDVTANKLLALNPDMLVGGSAKSKPKQDDASQAARLAPAKKVDLSGLSSAGAIKWGSGTISVTVFSDFRCGYCRKLSEDLRSMNVTVFERPISVLGSRQLSNSVFCASDRAGALHRAYAGEPITSRTCNTKALDENEAFASKNGFNGTPVVVRSDGEVLVGYRDKAALSQWLKGAAK